MNMKKKYVDMTKAERGAEKSRLKRWYGIYADEFLAIIEELELEIMLRRK